jgi:hypothetical protein
MNPLRWDVLLAGFVLSLPVLALGIRGDLTIEEVTNRVLWCMAAGWGVVALLRLASTPPTTTGPKPRPVAHPAGPPAESADNEPTPAP